MLVCSRRFSPVTDGSRKRRGADTFQRIRLIRTSARVCFLALMFIHCMLPAICRHAYETASGFSNVAPHACDNQFSDARTTQKRRHRAFGASFTIRASAKPRKHLPHLQAPVCAGSALARAIPLSADTFLNHTRRQRRRMNTNCYTASVPPPPAIPGSSDDSRDSAGKDSADYPLPPSPATTGYQSYVSDSSHTDPRQPCIHGRSWPNESR